MTKEFTAKQMHNAPGQVFRAADKDGKAKISHDHYKDRDFFLVASDKGPQLYSLGESSTEMSEGSAFQRETPEESSDE